jgi:hypothetical protein
VKNQKLLPPTKGAWAWLWSARLPWVYVRNSTVRGLEGKFGPGGRGKAEVGKNKGEGEGSREDEDEEVM